MYWHQHCSANLCLWMESLRKVTLWPFWNPLKFYTTYEANVSTDCAYLKYVPHVRGVSAVMCMTCAWQGEVEGQCQCCRCGVAACCCQRDVRMQRENGGREQLSSPGSRAVKGTLRNLTVWFGYQRSFMPPINWQRSVQISSQLSTYHV